ncbi:MAG: Spy/CpxP family protein refolding chaperone [Gemmatimonadales bacterium]
MIRTMSWLFLAGTLIGAPIAAQQRPTGPDPERIERVRQAIESRFLRRLSTDLQLDSAQTGKVGEILAATATKRRTLLRESRQARLELQRHMQPGVAADAQAVTRLIDNLVRNRTAQAQSFEEEQQALAGVLSPVQRARYLLLRERLVQGVRDVRGSRGDGAPRQRMRNRP